MLSYDILSVIFDRCDFISQIRLRQICVTTYDNLQMRDFYHIDETIKSALSDQILMNYHTIEKLDISYNPNITNINHLKCLQLLNASYTNISQVGIADLREIISICLTGTEIYDINHLTKLRIVDISGTALYYCGLTSRSINELREIEQLDLRRNYVIKSVNHLKRLKRLNACYSALNQAGIADLRELINLDVHDNTTITNVNDLKKLKRLDATNNCGIGQAGITENTELIELYASSNKKIHDVNHLKKLRKLYASFSSGIDQNGISQLSELVEISYIANKKIYDTSHMKKLKFKFKY